MLHQIQCKIYEYANTFQVRQRGENSHPTLTELKVVLELYSHISSQQIRYKLVM